MRPAFESKLLRFADFIIGAAQMMGGDFGQSDESTIADSGLEEFGQIATIEDLNL